MSSLTRLFVGNLPESINENDLQTAFSSYGEIANLDLKDKPGDDHTKKKFAFVTLAASNYDVESCIKHFSIESFKGNQLYVTRARESFLERLQRERELGQNRESGKKHDHKAIKQPVLKLGDQLNPRKRRSDYQTHSNDNNIQKNHEKRFERNKQEIRPELPADDGLHIKEIPRTDKKKQDSDKKRMESLAKKRHEFKEKQNIIKTGLISIDKVQNKKVIFSDNEEDTSSEIKSVSYAKQNVNKNMGHIKRNTLFEEDDSGDDVNFEIKKQFEGKKGQKVLDLQSRYKSDKRFVLDERFTEDAHSEEEKDEHQGIDLEQIDEKAKQLDILQDVLGVTIKSHNHEQVTNKKVKSKLGMLRFDPSQPEHAKFLAPVEAKQEPPRKSKKTRNKDQELTDPEKQGQELQSVGVSKEQFYKVSDTLKEAIAQPSTFSLRSLFAQNEDFKKDESLEQETGYIPLVASKEQKVKNPLDTGERNPFVYDSSDSETEEKDNEIKKDTVPDTTETKAVWKENLFFSPSDYRFKEGLAFFNKTSENEKQKERRELKSLMKKRVYNKERKNQMFQKKIGGRKKTMKKMFRKKS